MNKKRIDFFKAFAFLTVWAWKKGIHIMPICFHRTAEEQAKRYAQGRTQPGKIVTNCDGYKKKSKHQNWLAKDIVVMDADNKILWTSPDYAILGKQWEKQGHVWGGSWKSPAGDIYHFQL